MRLRRAGSVRESWYARRTQRLTATLAQIAISLVGRAGVAVLARLGVVTSRSTMLRMLMALPIPSAPTPRVLSVDDVALRRGHRYATVVIDAVTHRRVDVLCGRKAATLAEWLRKHPGVEIVCRDGSASYAEAIRQGAPDAVQVSDRWHLWHGLGGAVEKTVIAHGSCWRAGPPSPARVIDKRTRSRHAAVHELLDQGAGLLECARRLGWALNTVSATPAPRPPSSSSARRATAARWSTPTAITCGTDWPPNPAWR